MTRQEEWRYELWNKSQLGFTPCQCRSEPGGGHAGEVLPLSHFIISLVIHPAMSGAANTGKIVSLLVQNCFFIRKRRNCVHIACSPCHISCMGVLNEMIFYWCMCIMPRFLIQVRWLLKVHIRTQDILQGEEMYMVHMKWWRSCEYCARAQHSYRYFCKKKNKEKVDSVYIWVMRL